MTRNSHPRSTGAQHPPGPHRHHARPIPGPSLVASGLEGGQDALPRRCQQCSGHVRRHIRVLFCPHSWKESNASPASYVVDGNAYFFTATDVVRRLQFAWNKKAVIVGVGYPITDSVFSNRRSSDLTPPSKHQKISHPVGRDGKTQADIRFGEADKFLKTLVEEIMPFVEQSVLPAVPLRRMNHVLFGHSFGGLFSLYTLFTRPSLFDTYIAASPSIWWNGCSIVHEQEKEFLTSTEARNQSCSGSSGQSKPRLYITYGSYEQNPPKRPLEPDDQYEQRRKHAAERRAKDNVQDMVSRLGVSGKLEELWVQELKDEDHGSAAVVGIQRGIRKVLDDCW